MSNKAPRIIFATIALISLAGLAAPAEAAQPSQQRNVWCC
jgi:hypothetical protein